MLFGATVIDHCYNWYIPAINFHPKLHVYYRQGSFYTRIMFLKNVAQIEHKILIQNGAFAVVRCL